MLSAMASVREEHSFDSHDAVLACAEQQWRFLRLALLPNWFLLAKSLIGVYCLISFKAIKIFVGFMFVCANDIRYWAFILCVAIS